MLLGQRRDAQLEVGDVSAFQAVKHRTYVDELADLLPPFGTSYEPAKERRIYVCAVRAEKYEVLAERELQIRRCNGGFAGLASSGENYVLRLGLCLSSPLQVMLVRNSASIGYVDAPILYLRNGDVCVAGFSGRWRSMIAVD